MTRDEAPRPAQAALQPDFAFELFVEGESNRLAKTALLELAEGRAAWGVKGLFLAASGPWGKTHLLRALAGALAAAGHPAAELPPGDGDAWPPPDEGREPGLLIVDDAHLLAGRTTLQQRLIQFFDALPARRAAPAVVCAGPAPPGRLSGLLEPLRSRLSGGLVLPIAPPEYELSLALAVRRAAELGLELPLDMPADLVRRSGSDPRRLLGLMETIHFIVSRGGLSPAEALARLGPAEAAPAEAAAAGLAVEDILAGVAAAFGLKVADLTGHSRLRQAAWPRRVAMLLARELTRLTTTEIGRAFGGRDHSTVIHALKKIQTELRLPAQGKLVENIKRAILSSPPGPGGT